MGNQVIKAIEEAHAARASTLVLQGMELKVFPDALLDLGHLVVVDLSHNQLQELPGALHAMATLEELDVSHNQLQLTSATWTSLTRAAKLRRVDLSHNRIAGGLPSFFASPSSALAYLDLSSNQIEAVGSSGLYDLAHLRVLNLSSNRLESLSSTGLRRLESLQTLDVSHNQLSSLPKALMKLRKMRSLNASHNRIEKLGPLLLNLKRLRTVDLSYNLLDSLPERFVSRHGKLETLDLQHNRLASLDPVHRAGPTLRRLQAAYNRLEQVPVGFFDRLVALEVVDLSHNRILSVHAFPVAGSQLRSVHLNANLLHGVPPELQQWGREEGHDLCVAGNRLGGEDLEKAMEDAAVALQRFWRSTVVGRRFRRLVFVLMEDLRKRRMLEQFQQDQKRRQAATRIQSLWRAVAAKKRWRELVAQAQAQRGGAAAASVSASASLGKTASSAEKPVSDRELLAQDLSLGRNPFENKQLMALERITRNGKDELMASPLLGLLLHLTNGYAEATYASDFLMTYSALLTPEQFFQVLRALFRWRGGVQISHALSFSLSMTSSMRLDEQLSESDSSGSEVEDPEEESNDPEEDSKEDLDEPLPTSLPRARSSSEKKKGGEGEIKKKKKKPHSQGASKGKSSKSDAKAQAGSPLLRKRLKGREKGEPKLNPAQEEEVAKSLVQRQMRVLSVLQMWVSERPFDFGDHGPLMTQMQSWITSDEVAGRYSYTSKAILSGLEHSRESQYTAEVDNYRELIMLAPKPYLPKVRVGHALTVDDIQGEELARQLTLLCHGYFRDIRPSELLRQAWNKRTKAKTAPNVVSLIDNFNGISNWIAMEILGQPKLKERVALLEKFIGMGEACLALQNFHSLMAVVVALNMVAVSRLKRTWAQLSERRRKQWDALNALMSMEANFKRYRERWASVVPPAVPFMGLTLSDLTFLDDGNPSEWEAGTLVNWDKNRSEAAMMRQILQSQQGRYRLVPVADILQLLLQVPEPLDDKAMYDISLALEARDGTVASPSSLPQVAGTMIVKASVTSTIQNPNANRKQLLEQFDSGPLDLNALRGRSGTSTPTASSAGDLSQQIAQARARKASAAAASAAAVHAPPPRAVHGSMIVRPGGGPAKGGASALIHSSSPSGDTISPPSDISSLLRERKQSNKKKK